MDRLTKAARLREMLAAIAPKGDIKNLTVPKPEFGLESLGGAQSGIQNKEVALETVSTGRLDDLTDAQISGLEAIVADHRPAVFVRNGTYDMIADTWERLNDQAVRDRINPLLPSIGRIETPNSQLVPYVGTGFVVGDDLLATNRHVAEAFATGLGERIVYRSGDAALNFRREFNGDEANENKSTLTIAEVLMIHPYWDMALLRVEGLPPPLPLSTTSPEELGQADIFVVGYPAFDPRNNQARQQQVFGGVFNVKRFQPGKLRQRQIVPSFESRVNALVHDASTLGGNSGSVVIDIKSMQVIGLHFSGAYLVANYAVPLYELARDDRLAKRLSFKGETPPSTDDFKAAWGRTEGPAPPPSSPTRHDPAPNVVQSPAAQTSLIQTPAVSGAVATTTCTIPLTLTVSISVGTPGAATPAPTEDIERVVVSQDYRDRKGYDPKFLDGLDAPLPVLSEEQKNDTAVVGASDRRNGDPHELAYHHYSVKMRRSRRTAWFSAANVDGDRRPGIGPREGDRWYVDPRIDADAQLSQAAFEPGIDRGHLTRREDSAWGDTVAQALDASNDTFHFTNCSLQASPFNRGKDRWQGLEQFLLEQHAKKDRRRMVVITGPLFSNNDPVYRNERMKYSVQCPLQFWKVCVLIRETDGLPSATAFVLGQEDIRNLPGFESTFDVGATQLTIMDLQKRTGLSFGQLSAYDNFAKTGRKGALELPFLAGDVAVKPIRDGTDIVV